MKLVGTPRRRDTVAMPRTRWPPPGPGRVVTDRSPGMRRRPDRTRRPEQLPETRPRASTRSRVSRNRDSPGTSAACLHWVSGFVPGRAFHAQKRTGSPGAWPRSSPRSATTCEQPRRGQRRARRCLTPCPALVPERQPAVRRASAGRTGSGVILRMNENDLGIGPGHPQRVQHLLDRESSERRNTRARRPRPGPFLQPPRPATPRLGRAARTRAARRSSGSAVSSRGSSPTGLNLPGWSGQSPPTRRRRDPT